MAYSYAIGGSGWTMVPCMATFLAEVADCVKQGLLDVTNLGQIGDARHQAEPTSRHNPAKAPNGQWYVCAADFGGRDYAKLAEFHRSRWNAHDPRVWKYGFSQRGDGYGLNWDTGNWKWTGRDQGHCHFDVTMRGPSLNSNWWVDALASTAPWGLANWLRGGTVTPAADTLAPPADQEDHAMQFPFKGGKGSQYPDAVFVVANRVVTWVPGSTNDDIWKGVLDSIGRVNGLETNGRVTQPLNYQTAKPITSFDDLPVVDQIAALGVLVGPTPG